ncbi:MAG TPA: hypothetical protein VKT33_04765 [Candidatus Angelobacter sp.]|nr:hypothetical protein [Candidatus Angelobacter sp.]
MTLIIIFGLVLVTLAVIGITIRNPFRHEALHPVDMAALDILLDPEDEVFLRKNLSPAPFLRLRRKRIRLTQKYVSRIAGNAACVLQLAMAAPQTSEAVQETAQIKVLAMHIRIQCLLATAKLSIEYIFPRLELAPFKTVPQYQSLCSSMMNLSKLVPQSAIAVFPASMR